MPSRRRRTVIAALVATTVLGTPVALAHAPRDHHPGSPLMDLEVLVTPPLTGRTTPGGTDAIVSVDSFGNRFALAHKETAERVVGIDQRARAMVRSAPWLWTSADEGSTWTNLDLLPRGLDAFVPEDDFAVASAGPTTYVATATPAGVVLTTVTATKRGRVTAGTPSLVPAPHGVDTGLQLAAYPGGGLLLVGLPVGASLYSIRADGAKEIASLGTASGCDVAVGRRAGKAVGVVACLESGQVSRTVVDLTTGASTRSNLGAADTRAGGTGKPTVDLAADGTSYVLSGTRLWRTPATGRTTTQDLRTEGGDHRVTALAVSHKGRVGAAAYRKGSDGTWNIVVTIFTPGTKPVWSNFANHDPVSPVGASGPPSTLLGVDFDERGRIQVLWTSTFLHQEGLDALRLRNVWSVRSTTS